MNRHTAFTLFYVLALMGTSVLAGKISALLLGIPYTRRSVLISLSASVVAIWLVHLLLGL